MSDIVATHPTTRQVTQVNSLAHFVRPRHRDDIQGLRAVAVLLVALSHADVGFLKGGYVGVDVFFVLSGFLITQLLLSEAVEHGSVSLANFYVRRARRILPAAALTLVVTDIAVYLLLNFVRAKQTLHDSVWAALVVSNIHFANQATNYFAVGQPPSPVLHFWSLSLEEQFYFVWPTVLSLALFGLLVARRASHPRPAVTEASIRLLLVVAVLVGLGSLAWSVYATDTTPTTAYFSPFVRAWELALGAALAIGARRLTAVTVLPRVVLGWLGLVFIAVAAVEFSSSTPFPGYAALLPTVGAAFVIAAGVVERQPRLGAGRLLATAPMRYVGDRSYTFYLWHWPVLVIATEYKGTALSLRFNLTLLGVAFLLSIVTYGFYENPLRHKRWPRTIGILVWPASAAVVIAVAWVSIAAINGKVSNVAVARARPEPVETPGASLPAVVAAVRAAETDAPLPSPLVPDVGRLENDYYSEPPGCSAADGETRSKVCWVTGNGTIGAASSAREAATKKLVVMGDSHADMWMPAIVRMAKRDGWAVIPLTKSRCTAPRLFSGLGPANESGIRAECRAWFRWALRQAEALHPDATLVSVAYSDSGDAEDAGVAGIIRWSRTMRRFAKSVLVMVDTPYLNHGPEPADCLLAHRATMRTCTQLWTEEQLSETRKIKTRLTGLHGVGLIDTTGWLCFDFECPLVIDHTIAYRDYGHVSETYAQELAPTFRAAFTRALR